MGHGWGEVVSWFELVSDIGIIVWKIGNGPWPGQSRGLLDVLVHALVVGLNVGAGVEGVCGGVRLSGCPRVYTRIGSDPWFLGRGRNDRLGCLSSSSCVSCN